MQRNHGLFLFSLSAKVLLDNILDIVTSLLVVYSDNWDLIHFIVPIKFTVTY